MPSSHPPDSLVLLVVALAIEAAFGYPAPLYRLVGHPVTWIGRLIGFLDRRLNHAERSFARRQEAGLIGLAILLGTVGLAAGVVAAAAEQVGRVFALAALAVLASSLFAQRSLAEHVSRVARALRADGLASGREAVSHIVGRNPASLDEPAICRAAIESLAENFSDGIVAPAFWTGLLGLPGGALYKAVNTADSMIGHRTPRHEAYGWAAARLDDLVNLPASRLSALLIIAAAALQPDASARDAVAAVLRDAGRHRSPNAGWPEAAFAGALGLRLAGPRTYGTERVEDHWMGHGRDDVGVRDIDRALALYRKACWLLGAAIVVAGLALALAF